MDLHSGVSNFDDYIKTMDNRLFNRRGSSESSSSGSYSDKPTLNVNAPEFVPRPRKRSAKSSPKKNKRFCSYCKRKGMSSSLHDSHTLLNPQTKEIMCPILLGNECDRCEFKYDGNANFELNIHDNGECPAKGFQDFKISNFSLPAVPNYSSRKRSSK